MPIYAYEALNQEGLLIRGVIDAETKPLAVQFLSSQALSVQRIKRQNSLQIFWSKLKGVSTAQLAIFTRELATLLNAGLPIIRALEILTKSAEKSRLTDVMLLVREHVRAGDSLHRAFSRYPEVFNPVYLSLIQSGEISGDLQNVLATLSNFLDREHALRKKVKAAMTYPFVVLIFCVVLALGLTIYILPKFVEMFEGLQVRMPLPTLVLIFVVNCVRNPYYLMVTVTVLSFSAYTISRYLATPIGRRQFDRLLLTMPLFGAINRKIAVSRFCRTFATLFASGIPILHSLEVLYQVSGNVIINESVEQVHEAVKYGSSISAPLEESGLFPLMVTSMVQIGEQSGNLQMMLVKVADFYEMEISLQFDSLAKLIEPLMIGVMGIVVGFVLLAIFLPIYQLISNFK